MATTTEHVRPALGRLGVRILVTLSAVLAAAVVYLVFVRVGGYELRVPETPGSSVSRPMEFGEMVGAATIACFAGLAFLTVLERFTPKALTIWTVVAVLLYLATLPYLPGFRVMDRVIIVLMHTALAAVLILGLRRTATRAA
ncbi:DUF6069 family protein [Micromonospora sp. NPDC049301]|uniref:DUF6069 family protein n=1 Tax=Micromonospora sp. NPDC049301 TaxID=3155723 RepID=UPI0034304E72